MRWVESGDVRLAVFEDGDPSHPTILLLHGYPDTHRVWDEVTRLLAGRFRVVRYDVRGAGASSSPRDRRHYAFDHLMADLAAVVESVGRSRVHLVGHDWGSLQGWEAAARPGFRDQLASFTSVGGPGLGQAASFVRHGRRRDVLAQAVRSWYIGAFQIPVLPELAWATVVPRVLGRTLAGEGVEPRPGHPADTLARDARNGLELYRRNVPYKGGDLCVRVPVQLVEARHDRFVTPALLASTGRWADRLWHRTVEAGHWAQRGRPEAVAGMIAEFVRHVEGDPESRGLRRARAGERRGAFGDRLVVVTGAGAGVGRAVARAFAAHGAEVVCADPDERAAARTAEDIGKDLGGTAHAVQHAAADIDQTAAFSRNIITQYGVPDIVLNNDGINPRAAIRTFGDAMAARGEGGHLVTVTPALSQLSPAHTAARTFAARLRAEYARHGVGVTAVLPTPPARRGQPPERVAAHILRAVRRNQAVVRVALRNPQISR